MIVEIILSVVVLTEGYMIWNLFRKTELMESWIEEFSQQVESVQRRIKEVDSQGYFEADDEVGSIFEKIKEIVNELDNLKGEEVDAK
jgi:hypothetical protein